MKRFNKRGIDQGRKKERGMRRIPLPPLVMMKYVSIRK